MAAIAAHLQNGLVKFLVDRYMGHLFVQKCAIDNLTLNILTGEACVKELELDTQYINDKLEKLGINIQLTEGVIGSMNLKVPIANLLEKSCEFTVDNLWLCFQPRHSGPVGAVNDIVSSMIGSMATSRELANEFVATEPSNQRDGGVESCEQLIAALMSRFVLKITNAIVRISSAPGDSEYITALECHIENARFVDEQVEACQRQSTDLNTITSEPQSVFSISSLNKLLHLSGVTFHTDICSKEADAEMSLSQQYTSIYQRREREKNKRKSSSSRSTEDHDFDLGQSMQGTLDNFQSCYSHLSVGDKQKAGSSAFKQELESDPIMFGHLVGKDNIVKFSTSNAAVNAHPENSPKNIDIELNFQGLELFMIPSQIAIVKEIMNLLLMPKDLTGEDELLNNGGRPMNTEDFRNVEYQMQIGNTGPYRTDHGRSAHGNLAGGQWAGNETFQMTTRNRNENFTEDDFDTVNLSSFGEHARGSTLRSSISSESSYETRTLCDSDKADTTRLKATIASFLAIITHDDPLEAGLINHQTKNEGRALADIMLDLRTRSEKFFLEASEIRIKGVTELSLLREKFSNLCNVDHLLLFGWPLHLDCTMTKEPMTERTDVLLTVTQVDCCEFLTQSSICGASTSNHFDIFAFDRICENGSANLVMKMEASSGKDTRNNVILSLGDCHTELDISIVDRLSHLIAPSPFFAAKKKVPLQYELHLNEDPFAPAPTPEQESKPFNLELRAPGWTIDFRIPRADLRSTDLGSRLSYRVKNVHRETLKLCFEKVNVKLPKFNSEKLDLFWELKLTCSSLTGSFEGDLVALRCSEEEQRFLYATRESSIRENEDVCIELKYDRRNRSLTADNAALTSTQVDPMQRSVWGSFFQSNEHKDGPFSQKVIMRDNETLTMVGEREELMDFGETCRSKSNLQMNINVPTLNVLLPSHMFFEIIYNRLLNDLLLWQPCGLAFKAYTESRPDSSNQHFQPCKSTYMRDSDSESEASSDETCEENEGNPHNLAVTFDVDKLSVLIGTTVVEDTFGTTRGQIRGQLDKTQLFVVSGYHGDVNLAYFYISSDSIGLYHQNLYEDVTPYTSDVNSQHFATRNSRETVCIEPLGEDCPFINYLDDHRFALSMKIQCFTEDSVITRKDMLITSALQNSQYHVTLFSDPTDFWVNQLANFFTVADYEVPGYVLPEVTLQIRFNIRSALISYAHNQIRENSTLRFKLAVGSCDLSSQIVGDQRTTKFQCILENSKLHASNEIPSRSVGVHFEDGCNSFLSDMNDDFESFITFLSLGYFDFELSITCEVDADGEVSTPYVDIKCKNDEIKAYLCSDSLSMLINMFGDIFNSDIMKTTEVQTPNPSEASHDSNEKPLKNEQASSSNAKRIGGQSSMTAAQEEILRDNLSNAMMDVQSLSPTLEPASVQNQNYAFFPEEEALEKYPPRTSTECEDFCPIDEHPGHAVMGPSGDPYMRPFGDANCGQRQPSVSTRQERMYRPSETYRQHAVSLVEGSLPVVNINIKDITLHLFVYGGNDFGCESPEQKTYSGDSGDRERKRESRRKVRGGQFRDETVMIEFLFQKISYRYEQYGSQSDVSHASILSMHNMEIIDHLSVSKIKKMLYQDTSSDCHRRSNVPIIALRIFSSRKHGAKVLVSALPIRMNIDQDSFEFLIDFFTELSNLTVLPDEPVLQNDDQVVTQLQVKAEPPEETSQKALEDHSYLFDENDINFGEDTTAELVDLNFGSPQNTHSIDGNIAEARTVDEGIQMGQIIKEFTFSPAMTIKIDYVGKRVKTDNGAIMGLLIGMSKLHCTELRLKEMNTRKGVATLGRCFQFAAGEWLNDIRNHQLPTIFGSLGALSSITHLAGGVRDLVVLPVDEFRKADGHLVKGIQRGAGSFGVSAMAAVVDFTQGIASAVQGISEIAYHIVSPDYPGKEPTRRRPQPQLRTKIPNDLRAGLSMAYDTVRDGVYDTADVLHMAVQEDRAEGQWFRRLLQQLAPTMIRPIVLGSRATVHVLDGLRSQLQPDQHMAEMRKWRD